MRRVSTVVLISGLMTWNAWAGPSAVSLDNSSELTQLKQAYITLSHADHDYKGHRVKAMRAIEAACDLLGSDIRSKSKGGERQSVSDSQLREAQGMVRAARDGALQQHQAQVASDANTAYNEITMALSVK